MIPNQWYVILDSNELKSRPVGLTRLGQKMAVWRDSKGTAHAAADQCPHRGASLAQGVVQGDYLQCPFHGFEFDSSGKCTYIPAIGRGGQPPKALQVRSFPTREAFGYIWIWWGEEREQYPDLPWFQNLDDSYVYAGFSDLWPVHYTRGIENQLDVLHLPFVHASTIGRGNRTVVDGPVHRLENGELDIWVSNRLDDGRPARRADELSAPQRPPSLRFIFPNNWMNNISPDFLITISFVPVDEYHTLFYLRNWVPRGAIPALSRLTAWLGLVGDRVILDQDKRVVLRQLPIRGELKQGEILIAGDGPIIAFRKHREELKQ